MAESSPPRGALDGYTLVDLSGSVATATCGKLFADFGARVVNVEPPAVGHPTRRLPPLRRDVEASERSGLHALLSPHKESVVLDTADAAQRDELLRLVASADVVLEAEPPGALAAQGLGFERLTARAPGLILTSLTWFGQTGPLAGHPANDATLPCHIGQVKGLGPVEGPPLLPSGHTAQVLGGVTGFIATLIQLLAGVGREPRAAHLDVSLLEASMCITEVGPVAFVRGGQPIPRLGLNRFVPTFPAGIYRTRRGWIGVTALTPAQWQGLCELLGLPELGRDPRYQTTLARLAEADKLDAELAPALLRRSAAEWFHAGQTRRIPLAPVPTTAELLGSEQLRALDAFRHIEHPCVGELRVPGAPFRLRRTPARRDGPLARLGQHGVGRALHAPAGPRAAARAARRHPARTPLREPATRPALLRDTRIVDLTMGWAGPLAVRHLGDLGAEVIKVESCRYFDWWRGWEVTEETLDQIEKSAAFNSVNRNKLGITLDLSQPRGVRLLERLIAVSDALVENFSAAVLPRLGLDDQRLRELNPELVVLSMPPFGAGGPWHHYRAYGSTVEQASGLPHLQGRPDDPPLMQHVALGDPVAGVHGAAALLLALLHQRRTGEGQLLDLSHVEALAAVGLHGLAAQAFLGEAAPRLGSRHPQHAPQGVYPCLGDDQWLALTVESDAQWRALADLVGDGELAHPELRSVDGRRARHDAIDARLAAWTRGRERDPAVADLTGLGIPAAGVLDVHEVLTHPQLEARGFWQWLERAHVGSLPHPGVPWRSGWGPPAIESPAPTLGEHGALVLKGLLGLSEAEVAELERDGVIGTRPLVRPR